MTAILARFKLTIPSAREPFEIKLPPEAFLETLPNGAPRGCTFSLRDAEHAIRHALSLLAIIKGAIASNDSQALLLYGQNLVWLLDTLQPLSSILVSWPTPLGVGLAPLVQIAVDLAEAHASFLRPDDAVLYHKVSAALALVCSDLLQNPKPLLAEDEDGVSLRRTFCFALLQLAKASVDHAPTSRLVASGLLASAQELVSENSIVGTDTDVWVGLLCVVLRFAR